MVDFEEFLFLVDFELFFSLEEFVVDGFDFVGNLVPLFFQIRLSLLVLFDLLIVLADLPHSFKVLVVVFYHVDIRLLLILIIKFIFFIRLLFTFLFFLLVFILI